MGIPAQTIIQGDEVTALIPQKTPIVMVDTLYECSSGQIIAGLTINEDNMFCENGLFREPGIIEHIAQCAALKNGYEQKQYGLPPVIGYIGSVKNFVLHFLPSVGSRLVTVVKILHTVGDVSILHGRVECDDQLVAEGEIKIFKQN